MNTTQFDKLNQGESRELSSLEQSNFKADEHNFWKDVEMIYRKNLSPTLINHFNQLLKRHFDKNSFKYIETPDGEIIKPIESKQDTPIVDLKDILFLLSDASGLSQVDRTNIDEVNRILLDKKAEDNKNIAA